MTERRMWRERKEIPGGVKVLGVNVALPRVSVTTNSNEAKLMDTKMVFVELTDNEWNEVRADVNRANRRAMTLGVWIALQLGGYVKAWHE